MNKFKLVLLATFTAILLSGCIKMDTSVKINSDGSGDLTLIYGIDKQFANTEADQIESMRTEAKEQGYKVSDYSSEKYFGIKLKKHYDDAKEMKTPTGDAELFEFDIKEDKGFFKTNYAVTAMFDFESMAETDENEEISEEMQASMLNQMDLSFNLELPVKAGENNASEVKSEGKKLHWSFTPGIKNNVEVEFTKTNYMNIALLVVGIILIVGIVLFVIRKKKKPVHHIV